MPLRRSPEARLVFRLADPRCEAGEVRALAAAVGDWARLAALADQQMATPVLWRALRNAGVPMPAEASEHLRRSALFVDFRMQQLAQRLSATTAAFAAAGVPVLLLKGAAVGALVDPTFHSRPMTDLDVLVHRDQVAAAADVLRDAGWEEARDDALPALLAEGGHHHLPPFRDPRLPDLRVELHTALLPADHSFALDEAALWRDARPAPPPFAGASVPSIEHLLVHACIHFAWQHAMLFGAWRTFRLVGMIASGPGIDWDALAAAARATRAATACYWTLRLASRFCDISVAERTIAALAPPTPEFACAAIERHLIASLVPGEGPPSPSLLVSHTLWRAALRPRWSGHGPAARWDPADEWAQAGGGSGPASFAARLWHHAMGLRRWRDFLTRTLLGRS